MQKVKLSPKKIEKVFKVFEKHHQKIPLDVFSTDPFKTLIATMLSSRTNDDLTVVAAKRLFHHAPDIASLSKMTEEKIRGLIYPVGFYKTKAKHIKGICSLLISEYESKVPKDLSSLTDLPGVGRKTANLVLSRAFGKQAISVDTHVHRITNLLGWVKTKTPKETERELEKIIPKKYWSDINRLFVGVGRSRRGKVMVDFLKKNDLL